MTKPIRTIGFIILGIAMLGAQANAAGNLTDSGATQVVAKVGSREVTLSDLHLEIARLGLQQNDPASARTALQSIIDRTLLAKAAREARMNRQAEALRKIAAAEEQVLADIYLSTASHPPEPTPAEIDDYISANQDLFAKRKYYSFLVMALPTETFEAEDLTPLFNETEDFLELKRKLEKAGVDYSLSTLSRSAGAFPEPIRRQLALYGVRDNIVIKGDAQTQILKITTETSAPIDNREARKLARQILMQSAAQTRAASLVENLRDATDVKYLHAGLAPVK